MALPGFQDRIVHVSHRPGEGGIGLPPAGWKPWLCGSCCRGAGPRHPSAARRRGRLGRVRLLQGAEGVEVGEARLRRAAAAVDEHLAFWPVDLEAARGDRGDVDPAAVLACVAVQHLRVAVGEAEPLGVGAADQDRLSNLWVPESRP